MPLRSLWFFNHIEGEFRDHDPDEADARVHNLQGILKGKGIMARIETNGAAKAVISTWPGYLMRKRLGALPSPPRSPKGSTPAAARCPATAGPARRALFSLQPRPL
jgi:hypothetical protein